MNLRGNLGRIALAMGMLLIFSGPASAKSKKQVCFDIDGNEYLFVGKIPGKNKCSSFHTVDTFGIFPGFMSNGAACLSGDGSTLLFTTSDGYFSGPETVQGSIATSTATGSCEDCVVSDCFADTCSLVFCSGQTIPADMLSGPAGLFVERIIDGRPLTLIAESLGRHRLECGSAPVGVRPGDSLR